MLVVGAHSPQFPKLPAGESSPTSPDSFRQLDDVFLQTQTRIWLGEVLRSRLNEERSIADLLADGELLFEVSKEVWNMMLSQRPELKPYEYQPFASRNSGRYMPYSFVDSFLRMCKILGLGGIDLFSPSDVVEKGDTRKVCVCLRALSIKARSLDLNVPDFDIVTSTIAMPTDMVGYIRRSWELSLSEYSSSSSLSQNQKLRKRSSQEHLNEECSRIYSSVKEFGDLEINAMLQSDSPTNYSCNSSSGLSCDSIKTKNDCLDLRSETPEEDESSQCQQEEVGSRKIKGSFFLHHLDNDNQEENVASSSVVDSNSQSGGSSLNVESGNSHRSNLMDQIYHNLNLDDKVSVVEGSPESTITDDHQAVSAITGTFSGDSGSRFPKTTSDENEYTSQLLDGDDVEVSSVGSVNSMSLHVRNLDFDNDLDIEQFFPETKSVKLDGMSMKVTGTKSQDILEQSKVKGADTDLSPCKCSIACSDEGKGLVAAESCFSQWDQKGKCRIAVVQTNECSENSADTSHNDLNVSYGNGITNRDEEAIKKLQMSSVKQRDDHTMEIAKIKPQKRPILKAVVSGTAVVGAAFLLLHFRKNGREKSGESGKKSNGVGSTNGRNISSCKEQKARKVDGVYPAEKLKL